jgi:hypothetical protein
MIGRWTRGTLAAIGPFAVSAAAFEIDRISAYQIETDPTGVADVR